METTLEILARVAVPAVAVCIVCVVGATFRKCPKHLRWHFITALVWTAIVGVQTLMLLPAPSPKKLVEHLVLFLAGLVLVPAWRQLAERWQESATSVKARPLPARLLLHTLWGPLALWLFMSGVQHFGQQAFERAVAKRDLPTAFLLRDCGLGTSHYNSYSEEGLTLLDTAIRQQDVETVAAYLAVGGVDEDDLNSAMALAVNRDNSMITELLLKYGASANGKLHYDNEPFLYQAAESGKLNQVRTLLRHGAYRKAVGGNGETAFQIAKHSGYKKIAALLAAPAENRMK